MKTPPKKTKLFVLISLSTVGIVLLAVVYYWKARTQQSNPIQTEVEVSTKKANTDELSKYFTMTEGQTSTIYQSKNYQYQITVPSDLTVSLHKGSSNELDAWVEIQKQNNSDYFHMNLMTYELPANTSLASRIQKPLTFSYEGKAINNLKTPLSEAIVNGVKGYEYEAELEGGRTKFVTLQKGNRVYAFSTTMIDNNGGPAKPEPQIFREIVNSFKL